MENRIQEVMWIKSIKQDELSKRTGIKQSYLSEIITGQRDVRISTGQKYTLFAVTFIPAIIAFFELFFIRGRVDKYNEQNSLEIATKLKAFTS